tara:strand:+ start:820 stop:1374 length:555 start_codon:yes stop_codon:yes gene_type:complete
MTWLVLGLVIWCAAHLFKRVLPRQREALGNKGRALVALLVAAGLGLMIFGYRAAETDFLYALPMWTWHVNNAAMLAALFLMDIGRVKGVVRTKIRHPMLWGVTIWAAAHLMVNGDTAAVVLFGGLGLWALVEMAVINRAEGPWTPPERGSYAKDAMMLAAAAVLFAVIAGIHHWFGYSVIAALN